MARIAMTLLGLALGLAACTGGGFGLSAATDEAVAATARVNAEEAVASADWSRALTRTLRIRQNVYRPLVITLRKGTPYVLRLENGDDAPRSFHAPAFFQAIAVKSLKPSAEEIGPATALSALEVGPRQTVELAFVPMRDGTFPFTDGWAALLLGGSFGTHGVVTIH